MAARHLNLPDWQPPGADKGTTAPVARTVVFLRMLSAETSLEEG